jgi:hypothetical protein
LPFWPFRRKETLNERLLREAGLDGAPHERAHEQVAEPEELADAADLEEQWYGDRSLTPFERLSGEVTAPRPRRWDIVVSAEAPKIGGHEVRFVALADRSLIVDEEQGDADLTPLADAVEAQLEAPYRARGVRKRDDVWAVAARKIEVVTFSAEGDEIDLSQHEGVRTLIVDGAPGFGTIPELEDVGAGQGDAFVVRARRLEGDTWEVTADPL